MKTIQSLAEKSGLAFVASHSLYSAKDRKLDKNMKLR